VKSNGVFLSQLLISALNSVKKQRIFNLPRYAANVT